VEGAAHWQLKSQKRGKKRKVVWKKFQSNRPVDLTWGRTWAEQSTTNPLARVEIKPYYFLPKCCKKGGHIGVVWPLGEKGTKKLGEARGNGVAAFKV